MENRIIENNKMPSFNDRFMNTALVMSLPAEHTTISYFDIELNKEKDEKGYSSLSVKPFSQMLKADSIETSSISGLDTKENHFALHGINLDEQIASVIINEDFSSKSKKLATTYFELGQESSSDLYNKIMSKNWLTKLIKKYRKSSIPTHIENHVELTKKILLYSNLVGANSRKGPAKFLLANVRVCAELMDSPMFVFDSENKTNESSHIGIQYKGHINGLEVFLDANMRFDDNRIVLGRKTKEQEPGVIYGEYKNSLYRIEVASFPPQEKISLLSNFLISKVGNSVKNNYICINVEFNKKPLWQRLLKI
jgi:hypothetical protein